METKDSIYGVIISIHALRGEGDNQKQRRAAHLTISIHALRGEGDVILACGVYRSIHFNPRPPWGGRLGLDPLCNHPEYFNPRPPWGGRPIIDSFFICLKIFQSTPSVGRATFNLLVDCSKSYISIHALRGEGD